MKILNALNLFLIFSILANILLGFADESYFPAVFMLGAFIMPIFQLFVGLVWLIRYKENKRVQVYFYGVISYFFVLFTSALWWDAAEAITILKIVSEFLFVAVPILLAIYFTIILYIFSKQSSFMKAEWNDLLFINYEINPEILQKYVPKGTEIDLYNSKCYISLIGFMFEDVKVLEMKIPYHINFEEVNLRFYSEDLKMEFGKEALYLSKKLFQNTLYLLLQTLYITSNIRRCQCVTKEKSMEKI